MAITFQDLQNANAQIKTVDIKGKAYAEVPQRIKAFRMLYPQGSIATRLISDVDGVCIMHATVSIYDDEGRQIILGEGTAYEKESSSFINKTSYIENCETSAVGRALGMAGFGIDTSVASYEEVANAVLQQSGETIQPNTKTLVCVDCGSTIRGALVGKKYLSAEDMAKKSEDTYGEALCFDCAKKRKQAQNEDIASRTF